MWRERDDFGQTCRLTESLLQSVPSIHPASFKLDSGLRDPRWKQTGNEPHIDRKWVCPLLLQWDVTIIVRENVLPLLSRLDTAPHLLQSLPFRFPVWRHDPNHSPARFIMYDLPQSQSSELGVRGALQRSLFCQCPSFNLYFRSKLDISKSFKQIPLVYCGGKKSF